MSNNHVKVVAAIVIDKDKFLITQRPLSAKHDPLLWEFPGGKIKPGEKPKNALIREIKEELNLEIKPLKIFSRNRFHKDNFEIHLTSYLCQIAFGKIQHFGVSDHLWVDQFDNITSIKFSKIDKKIAIKLRKALLSKNI